ncbi:MAG: UDP-N-acetylmuramate--L-alanine ligase [Candidatus Caldarchaeum sp.]
MRSKTEVAEWFAHSGPFPQDGTVHFVGIGGAGMSALAHILLGQGRRVSGSDVRDSETVRALRRAGARVWIGHSPKHVQGASAVIISDAIDLSQNVEALESRSQGIPAFRRSQVLASLIKDRRVIAVTGSHGKSTTTAALGHILKECGWDPLIVVGANVPAFGKSVYMGKGEWAVVEACEAYDSMHDLTPEWVLLTNLEPEHLDYHATWEGLKDSIARFLRGRKWVYCAEDSGAQEVALQVEGGIPYGFHYPPLSAEFQNGTLEALGKKVTLPLLGKHNALNVIGAATVATYLGLKTDEVLDVLHSIPPCARRLELIGVAGGVELYDDYAHHPTEIRATLTAVRESHARRRLIAVFQPHLYTRTQHFLHEFPRALALADVILLTDIYPARESPIPGISSNLIAEELEREGREVIYVPSRHLVARQVAHIAMEGDVVVTMGAGDVEEVPRQILSELRRKRQPLKVQVFLGGFSAEREVSRVSGFGVVEALRRRGYRISACDPTELLFSPQGIRQLTHPNKRPDIVFIAMHGTGGEDGAVQGFLELLGIPYTGSGILAAALSLNKAQTKKLLARHGVKVAEGFLAVQGQDIPAVKFPVIVKPNRQGSTVGVNVAHDPSELAKALKIAWKYDPEALIEEFIEGIEVSVPVIADRAFPPVEIHPKSGRYDYMAKYTPGATEEIVPARISERAAEEAKQYALIAHQVLGLCDFSRSDFMVEGDRLVFLEINSIPGLTPTSLLPRSAASVGVSYDDVCELILLSALKRYGITKKKA